MPDELESRLRERLHSALEAVPLTAPEPGMARYQHVSPGAASRLRPPALGFAAGVAATVAFGLLLTGSAAPQVWLERAAGGVHRITDIIEPAGSTTPTPSEPPPASPSPEGVVNTAPTPSPRGESTAEPRSEPRPEPTASGQDGEHASPAPTRSPSASPTPSSDGGHDGAMSYVMASPSPSASGDH